MNDEQTNIAESIDLLCKEDLETGLVVKSIIQTGETAYIRFTNGMSMDFIAIPTGVYECRLMVSNLIKAQPLATTGNQITI